jgi:hypothetical protein
MLERCEKSGWFAFTFGLGLGAGLTYLMMSGLAAAYVGGLREVRWEIWVVMTPVWLAGALAGMRIGRRWRQRPTAAQP